MCKNWQVSSHLAVCLSACIRGTPTHWMSWNIIFGIFTKICQYIPTLVQIGQKCQTLRVMTYMHSWSLIKTNGLHNCSLYKVCSEADESVNHWGSFKTATHHSLFEEQIQTEKIFQHSAWLTVMIGYQHLRNTNWNSPSYGALW